MEWSGNTAAIIGIVLCVALLWLWVERNTIYLKRKKRDWE